MIRQMAHICFYTKNIDAMVDFYSKKLSMPIKFTLDLEDGTPFGYYFDCGNSTFIEIFSQELAVKQWGGTIEKLIQGNQYQHLCFEVTRLDAFVEGLKKKGVEVSDITIGMDNSNQAWVNDPDNNAIEFMEYTGKSLQLKRG
ncbi:MAG: glyoxalase [Candidatus Raymondbacteria bacterium RifOxyC12_full_50_8]|uniref:Glyoxalase n=1 Tax=Candidatus Raymondbacteria bacterium RIFOXYD12_FULL_49_13 TaxID=1817890 RepID=A0A1F7F6K2_UNCRA|nr:MAG: glyoxalase [Candidatus Raymondbacteria bacterium RIFOXYA2_FULL_49_16]OGJ95726.1 MAG: glyoxalase [Candidatus Raymondbacteria bacterium RifOxyC12_full_50_8]OGJ96035.1 MAG: glyoxalase [Candidatus Raymondbacteria bacterium RifOxyB12_full_50_8]OGK02223.1 MAG: glyoxalase [Candidatus Raymondbacteria bacterium RIFOXYD12_FULL_49_13]OGP45164.1 MAG: glyoxalase [Candidatus Raymondbacteria bacterium RIFOXYB2_FULL_49_35]